MNIIVPLAGDLARDAAGNIIVGQDTKTSLDESAKLIGALPGFSHIFLSATHAGKHWNNVRMLDVMRRYLIDIGAGEDSLVVIEARRFNTDGEMEALARFANSHALIDRIYIVGKWWHAPRAFFLCKYRLSRVGKKIPVTVVWCRSKFRPVLILSELVYAWPKNVLRVIKDLLS